MLLSPLGLRGISYGFPQLSPSLGHVLVLYSPVRRLDLTNPPKSHRQIPAQLACVKHAASVHPEPGSNSPKNFFFGLQQARLTCLASLHLFPLSRCCRLPFSRAVRRATRGIILSPVASVYSLFSFTLHYTYFSYCPLLRTFLFCFSRTTSNILI